MAIGLHGSFTQLNCVNFLVLVGSYLGGFKQHLPGLSGNLLGWLKLCGFSALDPQKVKLFCRGVVAATKERQVSGSKKEGKGSKEGALIASKNEAGGGGGEGGWCEVGWGRSGSPASRGWICISQAMNSCAVLPDGFLDPPPGH